MSDVSRQAWSFFLTCEAQGYFSLEEVLVGLPFDRAHFERGAGRIAWDDWAKLIDRVGELLGDDARVEAAGRAALTPTFTGRLHAVVPFLSDPLDVYRIGWRWLAPYLFRNLSFHVEERGERRVEVTMDIPAPYRACPTWTRMAVGTAAAAPRLLELPDARVVAEEVSPRAVRVLLEVPPPRARGGRARRVLESLRWPSTLSVVLEEQRSQIEERELLLRELEGGFRAVLEALPVMVGVFSGGACLWANEALREALRLEGAAAGRGVRLSDLVASAPEPFLLGAERGEPVGPREVTLRARDGHELAAEARIVPSIRFEGREAVLLVARDLTAEHEARAELVRAEETQRALLRAHPDLVVRVRRDGRLLDVQLGQGWARAAGLAARVGESPAELAAGLASSDAEWIARATDVVARVVDLQTDETLDVRTALGRSEPRDYECRVVPLPGTDEALVLARDVTERSRTSRQAAVTDRMAALGTVVAGVAHELNNPLAVIVMNAGFAREEIQASSAWGEPSLQRASEMLEDISEGARRAGRIVSDLHALTRASALTMRSVDLRDVLDAAVRGLPRERRERFVLHAALDAPGLAVLADPDRLAQVLSNLLSNAAQAMPGAPAEPGTVSVSAAPDGDGAVRLEVRDDGAGMSEEVCARAFEPFFTTKRASGGTGLGLFVSHRLVGEMGGSISVKSDEGRGTTFTVRLRRAEVTSIAPPSSGEARARGERLTGRRVLVVDDQHEVAQAFGRALRGAELFYASSCSDALAVLSGEHGAAVDLVLCDITLPDGEGMDIQEALRARGAPVADRFLFVTGGALSARAQAFVAGRADRCLYKPLTARELRSRVLDALDARGSEHGVQ